VIVAGGGPAGVAAAEDRLEVVRIPEKNHNRNQISESAARGFELVRKTDAAMTTQARTSWRWRIVYLRALFDEELFEHNGKLEGETCRMTGDRTKLWGAGFRSRHGRGR